MRILASLCAAGQQLMILNQSSYLYGRLHLSVSSYTPVLTLIVPVPSSQSHLLCCFLTAQVIDTFPLKAVSDAVFPACPLPAAEGLQVEGIIRAHMFRPVGFMSLAGSSTPEHELWCACSTA